MKMLRIRLAIVFILAMLLVGAIPAQARTRLYVGFGTSFGHRHSIFHHGWHYPHYRLHGGYYSWLDHDRWHWMDRGRYHSSFWGWPSCSSGTSIWVHGSWPLYSTPVVVKRPVVVKETHVVVAPVRTEYETMYTPANDGLYARLRNKKSELLKVVKIGDKAGRIRAITDLVGYSFDPNVKKALEEILLEDPDAELRKQVAQSLGKVKNKSYIPTLQKVKAEDSDQQVREQADKAIDKINSH